LEKVNIAKKSFPLLSVCSNRQDKILSLYIQSLNIPIGYEIETIPVENAVSMCTGYNFAMQKTDAKYKVYLHQNVFIINQNFIKDILDIFQQNKNIGLLGVAGGKVLPTNGEWMDAKD